ncbi:MAG: hypothetical protein ACLP7Q_20595 [Isosphaeraceae bacterium]
MNEKSDDVCTAKINAAFRDAARELLRVAKQTGTPVIVWENGQVRRIPWDQFDEVALKLKER